MRHLRGNPYQHELNASGTACEDGTSQAGALPCPACEWETRKQMLFSSDKSKQKENINDEKHN
jgi:hypothetical protein